MARVLLGISGGIAAYKTPQLVRDLRVAGHEVRVVLTASAGHFVSALSLATVSQHPVRTALFELDQEAQIGHIELARWPDIVLLAPATADLLARAALGRCDDLLTTLLLATRAQIIIAPAMNVEMWAHPATQGHVATLSGRGVNFVAPQCGRLACGEEGVGKMADLRDIVGAVAHPPNMDWAGKRVLVTAGPTREPLDAVRFLSNPSTGTMGFALAQAAAQRGASVDLVAGPVHLPTPVGVKRHDVECGEQMYLRCHALMNGLPTDWVFKVAAVVDLYLDTGVDGQKKPKSQWIDRPFTFKATRDVLASLVKDFGTKTRFLGFAAQTATADSGKSPDAQIIELARSKMQRKGCDAIFVNRVGAPGAGFGSPVNSGCLLRRSGVEPCALGRDQAMPKLALAHAILDELIKDEASP